MEAANEAAREATHGNSPISQTRSRAASAAESAAEQMIADINDMEFDMEAADKTAAKNSIDAAALEEQARTSSHTETACNREMGIVTLCNNAVV